MLAYGGQEVDRRPHEAEGSAMEWIADIAGIGFVVLVAALIARLGRPNPPERQAYIDEGW